MSAGMELVREFSRYQCPVLSSQHLLINLRFFFFIQKTFIPLGIESKVRRFIVL